MPPPTDSAAGGYDTGRVARIWRLIAEQAGNRGERASAADACTAAVTSVEISGAWVAAGHGPRLGQTICVTNVVSESLAEVQLALGEGPCHDAAVSGVPVLVADLRADGTGRGWAAFTDAALRLGAAAVFAFPLRVGAIRVGVLGLYRDKEGPLSTYQLGDALILADAATTLLLAAQAREPGDPLDGARLPGQHPELALHRAEIDQATGMLTEQLGVDITEAFARLRAYAYAQDRRLSDVARDIVARRRLRPGMRVTKLPDASSQPFRSRPPPRPRPRPKQACIPAAARQPVPPPPRGRPHEQDGPADRPAPRR